MFMHNNIIFDHCYCIKTYYDAIKQENFVENALAKSYYHKKGSFSAKVSIILLPGKRLRAVPDEKVWRSLKAKHSIFVGLVVCQSSGWFPL